MACEKKNTFLAYEDPIGRTRPTSALGMPKAGNARVKAEAVGEHVFHIINLDRIQCRVMGTLRHDDDCLPLADFAMLASGVLVPLVLIGLVGKAHLLNFEAQLLLPDLGLRRLLRDKDEVSAGANAI